MRKFLILSSICCSFVLGCDTTTTPSDAGTDALLGGDAPHDAFLGVVDGSYDGGPIVDGGHDAATPDGGSDAAIVACSSATCSGTHACVRGVCVLTCGADTTSFDAALAAGLTVVQSVCRTPKALAVVGANVYELDAATVAPTTTFTLTRWARGAEVPTTATVGTATFTGMTGDSTFPGGFVAVAPDEMHALFGYTTSPMAGSGRMSVGGVFDLATSAGTAVALSADNNYDATFLDATHFLVDGAPSAGQGLYRGTTSTATLTQIASHLGEYSGSVEVFGTSVLAGGTSIAANWPDGTTGDRVVVLDATALTTGTAIVDGTTLTHLSMPSSFELLSGGRAASLHYDSSFAVDAIQTRLLTRDGTGVVSAAAPTNLTTGAVFTSVAAAGTDIALGFQGGLLFVR